jgi:hypothetical protein
MPRTFQQESIGNHRKKSEIFQWKYCFSIPAISGAFLPEPARIFRDGILQVSVVDSLWEHSVEHHPIQKCEIKTAIFCKRVC